MRRRVPKSILTLVPVLALIGCQSPDVGNPCTLSWNEKWQEQGTLPPPTALCLAEPETQLCRDRYPSGVSQGSDYFDSGNLACEGLVCIVSPAATGKYASTTAGEGYCSKPCVSNADCYEKDTDLVCRQMVLDPVFIEQLRLTDPATLARYLSDIQFSSYCAIAR